MQYFVGCYFSFFSWSQHQKNGNKVCLTQILAIVSMYIYLPHSRKLSATKLMWRKLTQLMNIAYSFWIKLTWSQIIDFKMDIFLQVFFFLIFAHIQWTLKEIKEYKINSFSKTVNFVAHLFFRIRYSNVRHYDSHVSWLKFLCVISPVLFRTDEIEVAKWSQFVICIILFSKISCIRDSKCCICQSFSGLSWTLLKAFRTALPLLSPPFAFHKSPS